MLGGRTTVKRTPGSQLSYESAGWKLTVFAWSALGGFSCSLVSSSQSLSPLSLSSTI